MDAAREFVDVRALAAKVEDTDLWIRHTTVEAGLRVWLYHILLVYVALAASRAKSFPPVSISFMCSAYPSGFHSSIPCSCSSGSTSLDDEPLRRCLLVVCCCWSEGGESDVPRVRTWSRRWLIRISKRQDSGHIVGPLSKFAYAPIMS